METFIETSILCDPENPKSGPHGLFVRDDRTVPLDSRRGRQAGVFYHANDPVHWSVKEDFFQLSYFADRNPITIQIDISRLSYPVHLVHYMPVSENCAQIILVDGAARLVAIRVNGPPDTSVKGNIFLLDILNERVINAFAETQSTTSFDLFLQTSLENLWPVRIQLEYTDKFNLAHKIGSFSNFFSKIIKSWIFGAEPILWSGYCPTSELVFCARKNYIVGYSKKYTVECQFVLEDTPILVRSSYSNTKSYICAVYSNHLTWFRLDEFPTQCRISLNGLPNELKLVDVTVHEPYVFALCSGFQSYQIYVSHGAEWTQLQNGELENKESVHVALRNFAQQYKLCSELDFWSVAAAYAVSSNKTIESCVDFVQRYMENYLGVLNRAEYFGVFKHPMDNLLIPMIIKSSGFSLIRRKSSIEAKRFSCKDFQSLFDSVSDLRNICESNNYTVPEEMQSFCQEIICEPRRLKKVQKTMNEICAGVFYESKESVCQINTSYLVCPLLQQAAKASKKYAQKLFACLSTYGPLFNFFIPKSFVFALCRLADFECFLQDFEPKILRTKIKIEGYLLDDISTWITTQFFKISDFIDRSQAGDLAPFLFSKKPHLEYEIPRSIMNPVVRIYLEGISCALSDNEEYKRFFRIAALRDYNQIDLVEWYLKEKQKLSAAIYLISLHPNLTEDRLDRLMHSHFESGDIYSAVEIILQSSKREKHIPVLAAQLTVCDAFVPLGELYQKVKDLVTDARVKAALCVSQGTDWITAAHCYYTIGSYSTHLLAEQCLLMEPIPEERFFIHQKQIIRLQDIKKEIDVLKMKQFLHLEQHFNFSITWLISEVYKKDNLLGKKYLKRYILDVRRESPNDELLAIN